MAAPIKNQPKVSPQKPGLVQAVGILTLVSGIVNILWALFLASAFIPVIIATFGLGILCAPIFVLPIVLGVFEIIYAAKLLPDPIRPVKPSITIAILEICMLLGGNIISVVAGILALVFYNDEEVKVYFSRILP